MAGALVAGGTIDVARLHGKQLPGIGHWAVLGVVPILGAVAVCWCIRRQVRTGAITALALVGVLLLGTMAAYGNVALDAFKAPRYLVAASGAGNTTHEIRIGCFQ